MGKKIPTIGIVYSIFCLASAGLFRVTKAETALTIWEIFLMIGAVIGIWSKNQMAATSVTVPVMLVFAFLPMLSTFNDKIAQVARITYTEQISRMMNMAQMSVEPENLIVVGINMLIALLLFLIAYRHAAI